MFPNVGTKGTGEPVVQPAEREFSDRAVHPWVPHLAMFGWKICGWSASLLGLLMLEACGSVSSPLAYSAVPSSLPADGGTVSLSWPVERGTRFTLSSDPPLPGLPLQTEGGGATVRVGGNLSPNPTTYRLTLEAFGPGGRRVSTQTVEVAALASAQRKCASKPSAQAGSAQRLGAELQGVGGFEAPHVPGRLIVWGAPAQSQATSRLGVQRVRSLEGGWAVYQVRPGTEAPTAQALVAAGQARYVQPEYLYEPAGLAVPPHNPDYGLSQAAVFQQMNWETGWSRLEPGCPAPVVAVLDGGFYTGRADLAPNLVSREAWLDVVGSDLSAPTPLQGRVDPANNLLGGHGTGMAGVIAAVTGDGSPLAGAGYNLVKVLPIKVFDAQSRTGTLQLAQALEYAAGGTTIAGVPYRNPSPAQVVNLSLASLQAGLNDPYLESVLQRVTASGVVVVASSGNAGAATLSYPASSPYVIAVGATDAGGNRAQWGSGFGSNYGAGLEFVAPGTAVPVFNGGLAGQYGNSYGTSVAAPFISATIALYLYQNAYLSGTLPTASSLLEGVRRCLISAAQHSWQPETGYGLVDVAKVLDPANPACY